MSGGSPSVLEKKGQSEWYQYCLECNPFPFNVVHLEKGTPEASMIARRRADLQFCFLKSPLSGSPLTPFLMSLAL